MSYGWKPYVPAAERRRRARRALASLAKRDPQRSPVFIEGRAIATTFWGKAWCDNMERYSDFSNRLPRGRTYVRNGSVLDLQIAAGEVRAHVMGSRLYTVSVKVSAVPAARWTAVCQSCSGAIDSIVELLQGRFSKGVMEHICRKETGLFPAPKEIAFTCSCPDWASMCKHVAAVLYGIGARLDTQPELLFVLRKVDHNALIAGAASDLSVSAGRPAAGRRLDGVALDAMFGLEMAEAADTAGPVAKKRRTVAQKDATGVPRNAASTGKSRRKEPTTSAERKKPRSRSR